MVLEAQREQTRLRQSVQRAVATPISKPHSVVVAFALLTAIVCAAAIALTPTMSHAVFIPLIVAAAFLLSGRRLALAIAIVLTSYATTAAIT